MTQRIVTRPDFDGVVCAVLLKEALGPSTPLVWTQPNLIQNGRFEVVPGDVLANLPFHPNCALWFDHHVSNAVDRPFSGLFRISPSAAGLVFEYYRRYFDHRFDELVRQADKIDAARLSVDEILRPEHYPYILLSMAVAYDPSSSHAFCDHLVELLRAEPIERVLVEDAVRQRCEKVTIANKAYESLLLMHTTVQGVVSVTDFRGLAPVPDGNRFLVYSLFPQAVVNIKTYDDGPQVVVKLGHSIIHRGCHVNVGKLMAAYGGGGHRGAGACRLPKEVADAQLLDIIEILKKNQPD